MDLGLVGKVAIVTGGSRGIGRAIALALAREGARVAIAARGREALDTAVAALREAGPGPHLGVEADLFAPDGVETLFARTIEAFGGLDVLVNNVGGSQARTLAAADEQDFRAVLDRNVGTAVRASLRAVPELRKRGGGAIVMITSIWGAREAGGGPSYVVAKAGETALAKTMARELAPEGIRVNSVAPGSIWFPGGGWERRLGPDPDAKAAFVARELPSGRFGSPEEVADVVAFLCSPRASWVNGACWVVDGAQSRAF